MGNHEQGSDVEAVLFLSCVLASIVKSIAATWLHTSPNPAIQVQCTHNTVPTCSTATHALLVSPIVFGSALHERSQ